MQIETGGNGVVSFAILIDRTNYIRTNVLFEGYVRLRQFLGRAALRLGQARGPGAVATSVTDQLTLVQSDISANDIASHGVPGHYRPAHWLSLSMSSLCSLWSTTLGCKDIGI